MKNSHNTRKLIASTLVAAFLVFSSFGASADFIEGAITMSGDFAPTGGTGLGDATGLDFLGDDFRVDGVTGDLAAAINIHDIGTYTDFTFAPLTGDVDPLWAIGGFSFVLQSITVDFQSDTFLVLSGVGIMSNAGFDDTIGTWDFTGNAAGALFNFTAGSIATPEPGSLALLGVGLLGLAMRRRFNT